MVLFCVYFFLVWLVKMRWALTLGAFLKFMEKLEIIKTINGLYYKKIMPREEWLKFNKKPKPKNVKYQAYQIGYSQFKLQN